MSISWDNLKLETPDIWRLINEPSHKAISVRL